jgi:hypothetical protein
MRSAALVRMVGTAVIVTGSVLAVLLGSAPLMWGAQDLLLIPYEGRPGSHVRVGRNHVEACQKEKADSTAITWKGRGRDGPQREEKREELAADIAVPDLPPGPYKVTVTCLRAFSDPDGGPVVVVVVASNYGRFTVLPPKLPPAIVELSSRAAEPGMIVIATGRNYTEKCFPNAASVRVDDTPVALTGQPARDEPGEVIVKFEVPDLPPETVLVELACADGRNASAELDVLAPPTPSTAAASPVPPLPPRPGADPLPPGRLQPPPPGSDPLPPGPDPLPASGGDGIGRSEFVQSVPLPAEVRWTVPALLASSALFAFLFWALGFPSEPFNKTLEANRHRIRVWLAAHGDPRRLFPDGWGGFALYAVLAAGLLTFVEPETGLDRESWESAFPLALGFLVAVPVTTLAYAVPIELHARQIARDWAPLQVLPGALLFAASSVALTRWADLQPGYVYGLFAFYAAMTSQLRSQAAGRGVLLGSACLLAVSLAAWFAWPPVAAAATAPDARYGVLVLDAALAAVFVLGTQTLVFGLIPLTFLDGLKLKQWSAPAWALVWGGSLALLVHVLLAEFVEEVNEPTKAVRAALAFLAFGTLSVAGVSAARIVGARGVAH